MTAAVAMTVTAASPAPSRRAGCLPPPCAVVVDVGMDVGVGGLCCLLSATAAISAACITAAAVTAAAVASVGAQLALASPSVVGTAALAGWACPSSMGGRPSLLLRLACSSDLACSSAATCFRFLHESLASQDRCSRLDSSFCSAASASASASASALATSSASGSCARANSPTRSAEVATRLSSWR
eukprot:scaffold77253_cov60-Phaeocystis_antarctica.AAC.2